MSRKRQAKQERRIKRKRTENERNERRQQRLRLPMSTARGLAMYRQVDAFVSDFRHHRHDEDAHIQVTVFLSQVRELNLLKLQDHKFGIAQAVVSACGLFPEWVKEWQSQFRDVLHTAKRIVPEEGSDEDLEIDSDLDVDRRMVHWLVTGDEAAVCEVVEYAKEDDYAAAALRWYGDRHDDLVDLLDELKDQPTHKPDTSTASAPTKHTPEEVVAKIKQRIPDRLKDRVALITQAPDGRTWIVATRGPVDIPMPKTIFGNPVQVRPILPQEDKILQEIKNEFEEPV